MDDLDRCSGEMLYTSCILSASVGLSLRLTLSFLLNIIQFILLLIYIKKTAIVVIIRVLVVCYGDGCHFGRSWMGIP